MRSLGACMMAAAGYHCADVDVEWEGILELRVVCIIIGFRRVDVDAIFPGFVIFLLVVITLKWHLITASIKFCVEHFNNSEVSSC